MKNKNTTCTARLVRKLPTLLALVTALLAWPLGTRAANINWTNTLGGIWNNAANWSPNQVPGASDNAFITQAGTYTVTVNVNVGLASLMAGAASGTQTVAVAGPWSLALNSTSVFSSRAVLSLAGVLQGPGEISVEGLIDWTSGYIAGQGVLNANGAVVVRGPDTKGIEYRTINNGGTVTWTGSGGINTGADAVFNNLAGRLFDVQTDANWTHGPGKLHTVNNMGTFRKSGGAGTNVLTVYFNNTGTIEVQSGTLKLGAGGRQNGGLSVSAGATVDFAGNDFTFGTGNLNLGPGTYRFSAHDVSVLTNVTATLPNLTMSGNELSGDGTWTVNGPMNWTGGVIAGYGVLNVNGGMTISGSETKGLSYRTVNNGGTVTWTGGIIYGAGAKINNPSGSVFDIQTGATWDYSPSDPYTIFNNAGIFRAARGPLSTGLGITFNNTGTVEVQAGQLGFTWGFSQTSGSTLLKGGSVNYSGVFPIRGGLLGGSGPLLVGLTMSGQLSPGLSAGLIEVQGSYVQRASGSYNVEIGGIIAGTNYDQVVVSGIATLAGTINVVSINGFVPALGDRFEIMKFASKSGSVTFQGLDITNGIYLQPVFSATNLVLVATNAPLQTSPKLNLARNGDALWLWWPLGYGAFNVQATTNLNTPIPWSPVTPAELNRHTFTPAGPAKYFRMIKP